MSTMIQRIPIYSADRIKRRVVQAVFVLYAVAMLGSGAMLAGAGLNDYMIDKDPGRALARVTSVTKTRAIVEFQDDQGRVHSPESGLLYPTGLGAGQRVWVTYARSNPNLVKVQGREWTLAIIPTLSTIAVINVVAVIGVILARKITPQPKPVRTRTITIAPRNKT
ncbi:hypothetical protein CMUST_01820 [Corynebacterium mustelae]|uniref:DUF3592 family protein n=1 Tax=Corynebacterium mustelae TaxID=571915 RepID=A0A0G3GYV5_9CORY|nr:DUF3592 domain-containing protein [Corynebacterium mustelae]AKK04713.1 hypothetical protein CMUST_01820 [Corynebacterium mustelae]